MEDDLHIRLMMSITIPVFDKGSILISPFEESLVLGLCKVNGDMLGDSALRASEVCKCDFVQDHPQLAKFGECAPHEFRKRPSIRIAGNHESRQLVHHRRAVGERVKTGQIS